MHTSHEENTLTGDSSLIDSGLDSPPPNPLLLFRKWIEQAENIDIPEARGFTLSTADNDGYPSSRILLMKDMDETGIIFLTSGDSAKGHEMKANPHVAGTFWWKETLQQINFKGVVTQLAEDSSDQLFNERNRSAQAVASLGHQSRLLIDEAQLREEVAALVNISDPIARPRDWHGYHCKLHEVEFWLGSKDRFHTRVQYIRTDGEWSHHRLHP